MTACSRLIHWTPLNDSLLPFDHDQVSRLIYWASFNRSLLPFDPLDLLQ